MPTTTYTPLASVTLTAPSSGVTFSPIPSGYKDLVIVTSDIRGDTSQCATAMRFNSDSSNSYPAVRMFGTGSSSVSDTQNNAYIDCGFTGSTSVILQSTIQIMDYSATDKHKSVIIRWNNPFEYTGANAARWASNSAITSITIFPTNTANTFASGATISLYGIIG